MKKAAAVLAVLALLLAGAGPARAVELRAEKIRAFAGNILTVESEDGGRLTIEAYDGTIPLKNPVTDLRVEGGTVEIPWDGLSFGGEPLRQGRVTLRATLTGTDRTVEQTEITVEAGPPRPAMLCVLPVTPYFCANGKSQLRIEAAMSAPGAFEITVAPKDRPEEVVWRQRGTDDARDPMVIRWEGKGKKGKYCEPGEYVISAWTRACPDRVQTAEITLLDKPLPEEELAVTGSLIPEDLADDEAVWAALTAPVAVGNGSEGQGLYILARKSRGDDWAGTVACRTVGVAVLEIGEDGWVRVGAWRQSDGFYTEGYVKADKLRVVRPNPRYGAVVDKKNQTMTVYEYGKKLGTVRVSTGYSTMAHREADTHSGVFLLGTRLQSFMTDGHWYDYPIRIEAGNLIHQAGYAREEGRRNFTEEIAALGRKASHGCIRVDPRATQENGGLTAWWIWTHMGHDCKIIVTPEN